MLILLPDTCFGIKNEHAPPMRQRDTRCGAAAEPRNLCKHVLVFLFPPISSPAEITGQGQEVHASAVWRQICISFDRFMTNAADQAPKFLESGVLETSVASLQGVPSVSKPGSYSHAHTPTGPCSRKSLLPDHPSFSELGCSQNRDFEPSNEYSTQSY